MAKTYSIMAPSYNNLAVDPWNCFFRSVIRQYTPGKQKTGINDLLDTELAKYSAKWNASQSEIEFDSLEELTRFKLTYG